MLDDEVTEAIRQGRFHIWAVRTVDEGLEVLTGMPAGDADADGAFPEGTVNELVSRHLGELADRLRRFGPSRPGREEGARDEGAREEPAEREPVPEKPPTDEPARDGP
jgi:hypothetical protein